MPDTLPKIRAQRWLTACWSLLAFTTTGSLLHHATALGQADSTTLWQWYSPYIFPTWLLMMGTLAAAETKEETGQSSRALFLLCVGLIVFYGACLLYAVGESFVTVAHGAGALNDVDTATEPAATPAPATSPLIDSLKSAGGWLTGIQSVVNVALGGFFVMTSKETKEAKEVKEGKDAKEKKDPPPAQPAQGGAHS